MIAQTLIFQAFAASVLAQCMTPQPLCDQIFALETSECQDYHLFISRGSDSPKPGHQGTLIKLFCDGVDGSCGYENVDYPANSSFAGPEAWCRSAAIGARNGQQQLRDYAQRCPSSSLVVLGFSQGGSVALDILGGGGGPVFKCVQESNPPLKRSEEPGSHIVAASAFGAVRRSASQSYALKDGAEFNGTAVRTSEQNAALNEYSDILRDYCNHGDGMCAVGSEPSSLELHLNYFDKYNNETSEWLIETAQTQRAKRRRSSGQSGNTSGSAKMIAPCATLLGFIASVFFLLV